MDYFPSNLFQGSTLRSVGLEADEDSFLSYTGLINLPLLVQLSVLNAIGVSRK